MSEQEQEQDPGGRAEPPARLPRRQRLREATEQEIRDTAREHLRTVPPADLSLRAIARDMGLTAPALYRYYDGRDALLEALVTDAYDSLTGALVAARDAEPADDLGLQLLATCFAYRRWAFAHVSEFSLAFGTPVPGFAPGEQSPAHAAGERFGATFLELLVGLHQAGRLRPTDDADLGPRVRDGLTAMAGWSPGEQPAPPPGLLHLWLSCWARLHGLISLELYGHLHFTGLTPEELFRAELVVLGERVGVDEPRRALTFRPRPLPGT